MGRSLIRTNKNVLSLSHTHSLCLFLFHTHSFSLSISFIAFVFFGGFCQNHNYDLCMTRQILGEISVIVPDRDNASFFGLCVLAKHLPFFFFFFCICPPPGLLPVLGPLEQYTTPTLDLALLCSSRADFSKHKQSFNLLILITHVCRK